MSGKIHAFNLQLLGLTAANKKNIRELNLSFGVVVYVDGQIKACSVDCDVPLCEQRTRCEITFEDKEKIEEGGKPKQKKKKVMFDGDPFPDAPITK